MVLYYSISIALELFVLLLNILIQILAYMQNTHASTVQHRQHYQFSNLTFSKTVYYIKANLHFC